MTVLSEVNNLDEALRKELQEMAGALRGSIFRTICRGGGGHIAASLSIVEILTVLYWAVLRIEPRQPRDPERDRFVLSKGHAGVALYAVLAKLGFFEEGVLETFGKFDTVLGGHPDMHKVAGVEASTGALGHGFGFAMGQALAGKIDGKDYRVFALLGDGECQEGSIWEAALFGPQQRLDNFTAIIDFNKIQAMDRLEEIVSVSPLAEKWQAFGWSVRQVDGHDVGQLAEVLGSVPFEEGRPSMVIAHTVKGKGISFMEDVPIWHYRLPSAEQMETACRELGIENFSREQLV
ncbi:MAG: transketolase [Sedimentisphaerales bacterium]|nr:transketolase [Sedimentisphaerales bacterium]